MARIFLFFLFIIYLSGCQSFQQNDNTNPGYSPTVVALIQNFGSKKITIALKAQKELLKIKEEATAPLIEALNDKNPLIRSYSAITLGQIGDEKAIKPIITLLKDENKTVKLSAIHALGRMKNNIATEPLMENLNDKDGIIRAFTIQSLYWIGNKKCLEELNKINSQEKDPVVTKILEKTIKKLEENRQ